MTTLILNDFMVDGKLVDIHIRNLEPILTNMCKSYKYIRDKKDYKTTITVTILNVELLRKFNELSFESVKSSSPIPKSMLKTYDICCIVAHKYKANYVFAKSIGLSTLHFGSNNLSQDLKNYFLLKNDNILQCGYKYKSGHIQDEFVDTTLIKEKKKHKYTYYMTPLLHQFTPNGYDNYCRNTELKSDESGKTTYTSNVCGVSEAITTIVDENKVLILSKIFAHIQSKLRDHNLTLSK